MKKTKFYKIIHETKDPLTGIDLPPYFGLSCQLEDDSQIANVVFAFPTLFDPEKIINEIFNKARALYHSTKLTVNIYLFFVEKDYYFLSSLDNKMHQLLFPDSDIHLFFVNLAYIEERIKSYIESGQEIYNCLIFMYAYYCGFNELLRDHVTPEQLAFLNKNWENLLFNDKLQNAFAHFFMKNNPIY